MSVPSSADFLYDLDSPFGLGFNNIKVFYFHRINGICLHPTENQFVVGCFILHTGNCRIVPPQGNNLRVPC